MARAAWGLRVGARAPGARVMEEVALDGQVGQAGGSQSPGNTFCSLAWELRVGRCQGRLVGVSFPYEIMEMLPFDQPLGELL